MFLDRNTGVLLWRRLLVSPHRTMDPAEADFFFVPVFPLGSAVPVHVAMLALDYVATVYPFWANTSGYNHLVVAGYDFGWCPVAGAKYFGRILQLSHFGLEDARRSAFGYCSEPGSGPTFRPGIDLVLPDAMEMGWVFFFSGV